MEERRRSLRYPIYCPVEYKSESSKFRDHSMTLNISDVGALIVAKNFIDVSTNLILRFLLKGEEFFIRARTIHIERDNKEGSYTMGVEFLERPYSFTRKFYEELETIMTYQRQYSKETGFDISLQEASLKWYRNTKQWL